MYDELQYFLKYWAWLSVGWTINGSWLSLKFPPRTLNTCFYFKLWENKGVYYVWSWSVSFSPWVIYQFVVYQGSLKLSLKKKIFMYIFACKIKHELKEYFENGDIKFVHNNDSLLIAR